MDQDVKLVLEITQKWCNSNRMLLKYNKTNFMQFFPNTLDTIEFSTYKINTTNSITFLGFIIRHIVELF
jgi:hypothetical protein